MNDINIPLMLINVLSDGKFHSEKQLGEHLGISQARIAEHLQTLRNWGVDVFPILGKGYRIPVPIQFLDEDVIRSQIGDSKITVLPVVDSTNQYLLDRIDKLSPGDSCVAEYQQAGRGRHGRRWFSPFGVNLYLSMFWSLEQGPTAAIALSLVIGITVAEVLQELGAGNVRVKWPNDLYLHNRKLAGVLIELISKTDDVAKIVIGAGINIVMHNVQTDIIDQSWITLEEAGASLNRNMLTICLINELRSSLMLFEQEGLKPFLSRWERLDNFINRPVKLIIGNNEVYGISRGINAQGTLILEQDGITNSWIGGEISLRNVE